MTYSFTIQLSNGKKTTDTFSGICFAECFAIANGVFRHIHGDDFIFTEIKLCV